MAAKTKPTTVKDPPALGLDPGTLQAKSRVLALELPPSRPPVRMIEGDPETQARELIRLLHGEAQVI